MFLLCVIRIHGFCFIYYLIASHGIYYISIFSKAHILLFLIQSFKLSFGLIHPFLPLPHKSPFYPLLSIFLFYSNFVHVANAMGQREY